MLFDGVSSLYVFLPVTFLAFWEVTSKTQRYVWLTVPFHGNFFVGKLIEFEHLGRGAVTDGGATYKLIRRHSLLRLFEPCQPSAGSAQIVECEGICDPLPCGCSRNRAQ